jgi:hypothetical protein
MKTLKTLLTATLLSATVLTINAAEKSSPFEMVSSVKPEVKKVIVTGNTRVTLVQSSREWVSMDNDDLDKVTVKQVGNALTINSSAVNPVEVTVYVKNLFRIDASDESSVTTQGKLNVPYLQVMLKDHATARIRTNTQSLYSIINDRSELELVGTTTKHV